MANLAACFLLDDCPSKAEITGCPFMPTCLYLVLDIQTLALTLCAKHFVLSCLPRPPICFFHTHTNNLNSLHYSCLSLEVLLLAGHHLVKGHKTSPDSPGREVQAAQTALTKGVQSRGVPSAPLLACRCCSGSSYPLCASNGVILLRVLKTHYNFSINQKSTLIVFLYTSSTPVYGSRVPSSCDYSYLRPEFYIHGC